MLSDSQLNTIKLFLHSHTHTYIHIFYCHCLFADPSKLLVLHHPVGLALAQKVKVMRNQQL